MAKGPEAILVRDPTIKWCKQHGIHNIRCYFGPGLRTGWPDDIILIPGGRPLHIEFKAPGKHATPKQVKKIKLLKENGYDVCVCDSKSKAIKAITRALDTARLSRASERLPSGQAERGSLFGPRVR